MIFLLASSPHAAMNSVMTAGGGTVVIAILAFGIWAIISGSKRKNPRD
jgi:hypothetical protein